MTTTTVSAPGKVLVAGGYLVLDPSYPGVVVSTSSRFYTVIRNVQRSHHITVRSPQFVDATWTYRVSPGSTLVEPLEENTSNNKFVHLALKHTLALVNEVNGTEIITEVLKNGIDIGIVGDNDFYSQRAKLESLGLARTLASLSSIPPFEPTGVKLSNVHKTGLGSSAALITSLVTALLIHFGVITPDSIAEESGKDRRLAHNLAQFVHCLAQGKIGSGFDVAAAVFGSHLYTRFNPDVLKELMDEESAKSKSLLDILSPKNTSWDYRIAPFKLPPLTRLMLADVDAGSDTPSLVGKVLKWRSSDSANAHTLWTNLDKLNQSLATVLASISAIHEKDPSTYTAAVSRHIGVQASKWGDAEDAVAKVFAEVHSITEAIRGKMREMGDLAGVPIEPKEQTALLDACVSQPGVVGGGVPGAGGYDAIWLLVLNPPSQEGVEHPVQKIERVWSTYAQLDVSPLSAVESSAKGARVEVLEDVAGLLKAVTLA